MDPRKFAALKKFIQTKAREAGIDLEKMSPDQKETLVHSIKKDFLSKYGKSRVIESENIEDQKILTEVFALVDEKIEKLNEATMYSNFFRQKMKEGGFSKLRSMTKDQKSAFFKKLKSQWRKHKAGK